MKHVILSLENSRLSHQIYNKIFLYNTDEVHTPANMQLVSLRHYPLHKCPSMKHRFYKNQKKHTIVFPNNLNTHDLEPSEVDSLQKFIKPSGWDDNKWQRKEYLHTPKALYFDLFMETQPKMKYVSYKLDWFLSKSKNSNPFEFQSNLNRTININFLRYERLYTKLKYSRSPAYDIVSGGAAALLAGFIGFLVSEKFGFELVDSGDFYYLFMYIVFISFAIRPLLLVCVPEKGFFKSLLPVEVLRFYTDVITIFIYNFRKN